MVDTTAPQGGEGALVTDNPDRNRFEVELEFVQCLASPSYLNFLAQNEYFDSPDFVAYLKYLLYWRTPEYARFIVFPHALYFLYLLQEAPFREALKRSDYAMMLHQQQGYHWQFEKTMRLRPETIHGSNNAEQQEGNPAAQQPSAPPAPNNSSPAGIAGETNAGKPALPDTSVGASATTGIQRTGA